MILENINDIVNSIKDSILLHVPAKYIYFFGSHVYGTPHKDSDIDIYLVVPDEIESLLFLYSDIIGDLFEKDILSVDLQLIRISKFNFRKDKSRFVGNIINKGRLIYESKNQIL